MVVLCQRRLCCRIATIARTSDTTLASKKYGNEQVYPATPAILKHGVKWSQLLGISQATLRTWDRLFRQWLESPVGQKGNATRKRYTPNDVRVFRIVKRRRDGGQTFAEIKSRLSADLLEDQLVDDVVMTTDVPPMTGRNALASRVYELGWN